MKIQIYYLKNLKTFFLRVSSKDAEFWSKEIIKKFKEQNILNNED